MSPRRRGRYGALLISLVLHAGVIAVYWAASGTAEPLPQMRVYAVDVVSPPPREAGPPSPEPEPVVEETPEPEPEPTPAEPEPEPEPTPPAPRPEPSPPVPARRNPEPERPRPTPPAETRPPAQEPRRTPPQPAPSTGARPDPTSPGGEDLNVQLRGVQCPSPEYCNNIIRQVNRYFRNPPGAAGGEADVYFVINRDGSVADIRLVGSSGGAAFRLAVMEAVEQAGLNKAFGPLPSAYTADQLPVSFFFRPAR